MIRKYPSLVVNSLSILPVIITSIMIAVKFINVFYANDNFRYIGFLSIEEMNMLEIEFLFLIRFELCLENCCLNIYYELLLLQFFLWMYHIQPRCIKQKL